MNRPHRKSQLHNSSATAGAVATSRQCDGEREWDDDLPVPRLRLSQAAMVVAIAALVCYGNSYDGDFVFDDSEAILNNHDVTLEKPWQDLFFHDFWGNKLKSNNSHKSYRPLTVLTFRLNYFLAGALQPQGFHIVNICLHAVVCILLLPVFSILLGGTSHRNNGKLQFSVPRASLLAGVLFAVHPLHTECVSAIVGRADLLCAVAFLLAFLCYVKATLTDYEGESEVMGNVWLLACLLLATIATLCKEQGITVLGVCCAYDILAHHKVDPLSVLGFRKSKKQVAMSPCVFPTFRRHLALAVTGLLVVVARLRLQAKPPTFQVVDNPHSFAETAWLRAINYQYLYSVDVLLLLWPAWLCFDWSMGCVPVIQQLTDARILPAATASTLMLSLMALSVTRQQDRATRSCLLALAFIIVPFLPASNIFFRVGFVIAERILYLPSIGFITLVVLGASRLAETSAAWRKAVALFLCILIGTYSAKSIQRSGEWRRELSLFEAGAQVCPHNAKVHYNLGKVWGDAGRMEDAVKYYRHAIELHPEYDQAMNNLANILKDRGQLTEAEHLLKTATQIRPEFAAAWMNLAIVEVSLNKTSDAEASYLTALRHRRKYPDCYYNLGNLYLDERRHAEALSAWRNATLLRREHISAWSNSVLLLDNLGRYDDAVSVATEALQYNPHEAVLHYNLANSLGKADRYEESERSFLEAIRLQPTQTAVYYSNLGVLYHRWGKLTEAEKMYRKALQLDPGSPNVNDYLQRVINKLKKT